MVIIGAKRYFTLIIVPARMMLRRIGGLLHFVFPGGVVVIAGTAVRRQASGRDNGHGCGRIGRPRVGVWRDEKLLAGVGVGKPDDAARVVCIGKQICWTSIYYIVYLSSRRWRLDRPKQKDIVFMLHLKHLCITSMVYFHSSWLLCRSSWSSPYTKELHA